MTVNLKTCEYSIPKTIFGKTGGQSSWSTYMTDNNGQSYGYMNYVMLRGIPGKVLEVTGIWTEPSYVTVAMSRSQFPMAWANQWSGSWGGYEHSINNEEAMPGYNMELEDGNTTEGALYGHWWVPIPQTHANSGEETSLHNRYNPVNTITGPIYMEGADLLRIANESSNVGTSNAAKKYLDSGWGYYISYIEHF